jgi:hypothetical protein
MGFGERARTDLLRQGCCRDKVAINKDFHHIWQVMETLIKGKR